MRIGIDASELTGRPTGVGRYLGGLLREWKRMPEAAEHEFVLYSPGPLAAPWNGSQPTGPDASDAFERRQLTRRSRVLWEHVVLARALAADRLDVFFAPAYSGPIAANVPLVLTVHDVSFAAHPEWFTWREGLRRRWLTRRSVRAAARVLTDSQFSRSEIVHRLGVPADRVQVIHPGVPVHRLSEAGGARGPADREPLVLFVGSIFNRRRLPDLLAAFRRVIDRDARARLTIVGENRTYPHQDLAVTAAAAGVTDSVTITAYAPDEVVTDLYRTARVFVFLSEYEGFGLPPLEALAAHVPIVVLDTPVAREIYGPAATYVRAGDIQGTAAAIERLLWDASARGAALAHAGDILQRYSPARAARLTLEAITSAPAAGPA